MRRMRLFTESKFSCKVDATPFLSIVIFASQGIFQGLLKSNFVAFNRTIDEFRSLLVGSADARQILPQPPQVKSRSGIAEYDVATQVGACPELSESGPNSNDVTPPIIRNDIAPIRKRRQFNLAGFRSPRRPEQLPRFSADPRFELHLGHSGLALRRKNSRAARQ